VKAIVCCIVILALHFTIISAQDFNGTVLISPRTSNESFLLDKDFNVLKTWTGSSLPATFAYLLSDNSVLRPTDDPAATWGAGGAGGRLQRINTNNIIVWDYIFSDDTVLQHHDIEPMPNGNVLVIAWERMLEAEAIAAGRQSMPIGEIWPTMIAELEPVGATGANIVWEWHLKDHFIQDADPTKDNYGVIADHPELVDINHPVAPNGSFDHANAIDYHPELDQIVFSARAMSEIYIIDHSTTTAEAAGHTGGNSGKGGDILYRWGNPQVYDHGTAGDQYFYSVHGANWIDPGLPGGDNLMIFNNGNRAGGLNDYSGAVEIVPPMDGHGNYIRQPGQPFGPATPIWVYEGPPEFYSANKGGCYRLPNGNTLICDSNNLSLFEVTREGTKVWAYAAPAELHRAPPYWSDPTAIVQSAPAKGYLRQNHPNPFNPSTTIRYSITEKGYVSLAIYDVNGSLVRTLVAEHQSPSAEEYSVTWNGRNDRGNPVASGIYLYKLATDTFSQTLKMVVLK
jgi:hypothetical protein